ncbi:hypothetical protein ID866_12736 [Astraeus odoratus]|nr:hypothetical protein ID866_12736 [Astraeus odoratus]
MSEQLQIALKDIAHCASQSGINLNGRVDRRGLYVRGASALVYQGTLRPAGARIAVKTILSGTPSSKKDIIELGLTTEFYFNISIVSAWMETGNAHDYVQEQSVDPRPLIDGIAQGLLYLHTYKQGPIVHGNLKGSNVLISPEGRALLTDFGLYPVFNSTLTVSLGISHGRSMNWMPPEYVDIGEVTAKGDVWAFAMTALVSVSCLNSIACLL